MNHAEWVQEFQQVLRMWKSKKAGARDAANQLLRKTRHASRASVTQWHEGQMLGVFGVLAEAAAEPRKALLAYQRLASFHREQLNEHGHSLASALESAGMAALKVGDKNAATRLAREVVRLRADFQYFTPATEKLVSALSEERRAYARQRGPLRKGERRKATRDRRGRK